MQIYSCLCPSSSQFEVVELFLMHLWRGKRNCHLWLQRTLEVCEPEALIPSGPPFLGTRAALLCVARSRCGRSSKAS